MAPAEKKRRKKLSTMLLFILSAVLASLLGWLFFQQYQHNQYWAKRGVPHSPPHPILGSLTFIFKSNVGEWIRDLHGKYGEPLFGIWAFRQPVLVIADPQVARRVLVQDSDLFRNRFLGSGRSDPIGALNLFTVNDPTWTSVRRRLTYIFTGAKLKARQTFSQSKAKELVQRIRRDKKEKKEIELRYLFSDFTTDIIGTFAFGIENNSILTGDSPIRAVTREFGNFNFFRGFSWLSIFFWPGLVDIFGFSLFPKKTTEFFRKTIDTIIKQRSAVGMEKNDMLDALVKMKKEGLDGGQEFSDDLLAAQACIILQGGFDSTASTLTFTIFELAHNPETQERLYRELVEVKQQNNAELDFNTLEKLTYLNCVIKEILRRYPAMGWLDRIAATDYKINDKLTISRGTPVYVNAIGMHHDPKYFSEPYVFKPDRFLPENEKNIVPFSYLPFGDGPRVCIGQRFTLMTLRFAISELVRKVQFKPLPGYPRPTEIQFEKKGLFLSPGQPLAVEFIMRD